jgi:glycerol-3-phosphate responsive antiterminator
VVVVVVVAIVNLRFFLAKLEQQNRIHIVHVTQGLINTKRRIRYCTATLTASILPSDAHKHT